MKFKEYITEIKKGDVLYYKKQKVKVIDVYDDTYIISFKGKKIGAFKYLNEDVKDYKTLVNMIAIVGNKKDLEYITDVVEKALKNKMINDKEYKKLQQEIKLLKRV